MHVSCHAAGLFLRPSEVNACAGEWPVPSGTVAALRKIWRGLKGQRQFREALRVLQRALVPGDVDICAITALLWFWNKGRKEIIGWGRA